MFRRAFLVGGVGLACWSVSLLLPEAIPSKLSASIRGCGLTNAVNNAVCDSQRCPMLAPQLGTGWGSQTTSWFNADCTHPTTGEKCGSYTPTKTCF